MSLNFEWNVDDCTVEKTSVKTCSSDLGFGRCSDFWHLVSRVTRVIV